MPFNEVDADHLVATLDETLAEVQGQRLEAAA
jgi:hypothetical protein